MVPALRFRLSKEATGSLLTCVMCMATVLAAGCSTTLDGVFPDGRPLAEAPVEWAGVTTQRGDKRIASEKYLPLEKGDLIQTDSRTYALIRFASGTEAYLAPNSRARIGSLDEFFGEVLAKVRGAFEVRTQYITAAAKGTVSPGALNLRGCCRGDRAGRGDRSLVQRGAMAIH